VSWKPVILVVEDDPRTMEIVVFGLQQAGYEVMQASTAEQGLTMARQCPPDLAVLDIMLPGMNGLDLCSHLREYFDIPVMMLTALGQDDDIVRGLERGADDYLAKPFSLKVLIARVGALMRRQDADASHTTISFGSLVIDFAGHAVYLNGEPVHLTPIEFRIVSLLARRAGRVTTFRQLLREAAGYDAEDQEAQSIIKVHMSHLRRKLEADPRNPCYIINSRGMGYKLLSSTQN
jgi:DNA-binding response OmpR family regulator